MREQATVETTVLLSSEAIAPASAGGVTLCNAGPPLDVATDFRSQDLSNNRGWFTGHVWLQEIGLERHVALIVWLEPRTRTGCCEEPDNMTSVTVSWQLRFATQHTPRVSPVATGNCGNYGKGPSASGRLGGGVNGFRIKQNVHYYSWPLSRRLMLTYGSGEKDLKLSLVLKVGYRIKLADRLARERGQAALKILAAMRHSPDDGGFTEPMYDCAVVCREGAELPCHKAVLAAASPVFAAKFRNCNSNVVAASKYDAADFELPTMAAVLDFVYTQQLWDRKKLLQESRKMFMPRQGSLSFLLLRILLAADMYDLPRLAGLAANELIIATEEKEFDFKEIEVNEVLAVAKAIDHKGLLRLCRKVQQPQKLGDPEVKEEPARKKLRRSARNRSNRFDADPS